MGLVDDFLAQFNEGSEGFGAVPAHPSPRPSKSRAGKRSTELAILEKVRAIRQFSPEAAARNEAARRERIARDASRIVGAVKNAPAGSAARRAAQRVASSTIARAVQSGDVERATAIARAAGATPQQVNQVRATITRGAGGSSGKERMVGMRGLDGLGADISREQQARIDAALRAAGQGGSAPAPTQQQQQQQTGPDDYGVPPGYAPQNRAWLSADLNAETPDNLSWHFGGKRMQHRIAWPQVDNSAARNYYPSTGRGGNEFVGSFDWRPEGVALRDPTLGRDASGRPRLQWAFAPNRDISKGGNLFAGDRILSIGLPLPRVDGIKVWNGADWRAMTILPGEYMPPGWQGMGFIYPANGFPSLSDVPADFWRYDKGVGNPDWFSLFGVPVDLIDYARLGMVPDEVAGMDPTAFWTPILNEFGLGDRGGPGGMGGITVYDVTLPPGYVRPPAPPSDETAPPSPSTVGEEGTTAPGAADAMAAEGATGGQQYADDGGGTYATGGGSGMSVETTSPPVNDYYIPPVGPPPPSGYLPSGPVTLGPFAPAGQDSAESFEDGVMLDDGTVVFPDGTVVSPSDAGGAVGGDGDGAIVLDDGTVIMPDGSVIEASTMPISDGSGFVPSNEEMGRQTTMAVEVEA